MIVIFCGVPACGKSTAAKGLVRRLEDLSLDYEFMASDDLSRNVYERVFRFLEDNTGRTGYLVVDATFYKKKWRKEARRIAEEHDEGLITVYLHCSLETSLRRNEQRGEEDRVEEKAIHIIDEELERPEHPDLEFDTDRTDPSEVVDRVLKELMDLRFQK